ncbi:MULTISPECIES: alpha-L-fucosidase [Streptomyces]|uniref:alpha-L-fucosidase n=2 Tax=Streptomyces rimosus subsp. rimosus TaxID=132474 RepID=L8EQN0_STRR1|nr:MULTISPECIES: alpha-L-fucosidase [Streptomyces]KOG71903.1 alpha-L-fucosidase [Kitasatospora aureofaciens]MYT48643.1 alpha-L-fucosidase [Streptomyces sp. SID5471]KEF06083.1 alpha-L-fucosidase [Streptomyces rimosus]KEF19077.1 alpha-L-fucosidase [Streptomyces rimosus]KOT26722.1 alpha-L-fucosidase [Streptomyces sp. NRRL WC-3701]
MARSRSRARLRTVLALTAAALTPLAPLQATAAGPPASAPAHRPAASPCHAPVRPASQMTVEPCDTPARIIEKAANIVPTAAQRAWQQREVTAFTHFGMNTFTGREWGSGTEDPKRFAPPRIDVAQWMRAYKAAGAEQVMLTVKHHDGFVLYPSRYTPHSVLAAPDKPDVVGAYVRAARAAGLKVGLYLSPSDGAELPHAWHARWVEEIRRKQAEGEPLSLPERVALEDRGRTPAGLGRFGNGSPVTERTIPTLVPGDDRAAAVRSGRLPSFTVRADDYDAYYLNQVYELLTQYGPVEELWLDGANPWADAGITQPYDVRQWFETIRRLSPRTVVFQGPQGVRWVGNEKGVARETEWSVTPSAVDPWSVLSGGLPNDSTDADIGSRAKLLAPGTKYLQWYPAEADVSIRPGWFHHPWERPKTPGQLLDLYEKSVGRNASLLLNVPPGPDGRIAAADAASLTAFGRAVRETYGRDLLKGGRAAGAVTFDRVAVGEDLRHGQRVERFAVEARTGGTWRRIAEGTTVGHRRILALPAPVTADAVRVRVLAARATPHLGPVTVHPAGR